MIAKLDEKFMRIALGEAKYALEHNRIPVGAVIVKDGKVVTFGRKTGEIHPLFDHAEHNACYGALWDPGGSKNLRGTTVYTTLEPCIMCVAMLMTVRVERIVYGLIDPNGGGKFMLNNPKILPERFKKERPIIKGGCLKDESKALLRQFFERQTEGNWSNKENALVKLCCS